MKSFRELFEGEPKLVPAIKHQGKIYKGKAGQEHWEVEEKHLKGFFTQGAEYGFVNHKGHFLDRARAHEYGVRHDLLNDDGRGGGETWGFRKNELTTDGIKGFSWGKTVK